MREVKLSVFYPHPPQRVWSALVDRRALNTWMMKNDFEPKLGHKFRFEPSLPGLEAIECEVVELVAPKRLAYTWQDMTGETTLVIWTLTPVEDGTQLQLTHQKYGFAVALQGQQLEPEAIRNPFLYESNWSPSALTFNLPSINTLRLKAANDCVIDLATKEEWEYRLANLMETLPKKS
ncbi:MAG: SRPBCC domain-containing protein [Cyanophyceae cyanobacterium]